MRVERNRMEVNQGRLRPQAGRFQDRGSAPSCFAGVEVQSRADRLLPRQEDDASVREVCNRAPRGVDASGCVSGDSKERARQTHTRRVLAHRQEAFHLGSKQAKRQRGCGVLAQLRCPSLRRIRAPVERHLATATCAAPRRPHAPSNILLRAVAMIMPLRAMGGILAESTGCC